MTPIIVEIALYLLVSISMGYLFGWLIAHAMLKNKFERQIEAFKENYPLISEGREEIQQELFNSKSISKELQSKNNKILLENNNKKLQLHEIGIKFKELKKKHLLNESLISSLKHQLTEKENQLIQIKQEIESQKKLLLFNDLKSSKS